MTLPTKAEKRHDQKLNQVKTPWRGQNVFGYGGENK
jgi:hypothetical protein